ncbi:MAG: rhodanese-like domain-containing protein [Cyclobacteriaceae bacterium]
MFSILNKKYKTIDVATFKKMRRAGDVTILDVRSRGEQQSGVINGQRNLNVMDPAFKEKLSKMDKEKLYLVYCRSGSRSARACRIMTKSGFEKVYNLKGGYLAWEREEV